ncbi:MAG: ABC transporter substrate-binding protein [Caldilineaceae bacterium]
MTYRWLNLGFLLLVALAVGACAAQQQPLFGTGSAESANRAAVEDYTTPHPVLSDIRVRQAIAHCIDRDALLAAVYPYVEDKTALRMDSFLPKTHWAYGGPYQDYDYDVETGSKLLEEAGWVDSDGDGIREKGNDVLALKLTTTTAQFRQTFTAVMEQNLLDCGIQLIRLHTPASWFFAPNSGLQRRDFELAVYAWLGQSNPSGQTLYACDQIPLPSNNWTGQNYMGWCNETAHSAITLANNTLDRVERIAAYNSAQAEFAADLVSFPLFQRAEAEAWRSNLLNFRPDPTEKSSANSWEWALADGGDTVVAGFSQEPATMFTLIASASVQVQIAQMAKGNFWTQYNYDFQPLLQDPLSTLESGLATNTMVEVTVGDTIYNAAGQPEILQAGTQLNVDGAVMTYTGEGTLQLPQLTVTYVVKPYTWSDGTPGSVGDIELAHQIECDKESGAVTFILCDAMAEISYSESELATTISYWPGYQSPVYQLYPYIELYPSHQVLSDGRMLKDVPANEWQTLVEIAEKPLSYGPFMVVDWQKGDRMTLERNPYFAEGTGVARIVIVFVQDTNQAVAQLLGGEVDYLEKSTLGGGAEVQTLIDAAAQGDVQIEIVPSPTWEHLDFNLYTK